MKSHVYDFNLPDVARFLAGPLLVLAILVGGVRLAAWLDLLSAPRPTLDTDRTILIHQAEAARAPSDAQVLLIGDSSCLMNVNARQLGEVLGLPTLNLGTFSFLDLNQYTEVLRRFVAANPGRLRAVVLLMNPEALRRVSAEPYYVNILTSFWAGRDNCREASFDDQVACALGIEVFRGRVLARVLPIPLGGAFGRHYGFDSNLEDFMLRERGSVIDPVFERASGKPEFRLSPTLKPASAAFRAVVPAGATLVVGITPVPQPFAGGDYPALRSGMLRQWGEWLRADHLLETLPVVLLEDQFARPTHLNAGAVPRYTTELGKQLAPLVR